MNISRHPRARRNLIVGFVFPAILTLIPLGLSVGTEMPSGAVFGIIGFTAIAQVRVHLRYFLHISLRGSQSELVFGLLFTFVIVRLMVGGTLWVMASFSANMPKQM